MNSQIPTLASRMRMTNGPDYLQAPAGRLQVTGQPSCTSRRCDGAWSGFRRGDGGS